MPIFQYKCKQCDQVSDYIEKVGVTTPHGCKHCGSTDTEKILSTFATPTPSLGTRSSGCNNGGCTNGQCPLAK